MTSTPPDAPQQEKRANRSAKKPPGEEGARVTATLEGFPLWALRNYQRATREGEKVALAYIIKRWTQLDPEATSRKVTADDYEAFMGGGELVAFPGVDRGGTSR